MNTIKLGNQETAILSELLSKESVTIRDLYNLCYFDKKGNYHSGINSPSKILSLLTEKFKIQNKTRTQNNIWFKVYFIDARDKVIIRNKIS